MHTAKSQSSSSIVEIKRTGVKLADLGSGIHRAKDFAVGHKVVADM